jgi:hypothetical protein
LEEQRLNTYWQKKVFSKLLGLLYRIIYKKGKENVAADALSWKIHEPILTVAAISICQPPWMDDVTVGYDKDEEAKKLLIDIALKPANSTIYTLDNGLIRHKGRVWIGNNLELQTKIFQAFHSSSLGGHSGAPVTYKRIKQLFMWPGSRNK